MSAHINMHRRFVSAHQRNADAVAEIDEEASNGNSADGVEDGVGFHDVALL